MSDIKNQTEETSEEVTEISFTDFIRGLPISKEDKNILIDGMVIFASQNAAHYVQSILSVLLGTNKADASDNDTQQAERVISEFLTVMESEMLASGRYLKDIIFNTEGGDTSVTNSTTGPESIN